MDEVNSDEPARLVVKIPKNKLKTFEELWLRQQPSTINHQRSRFEDADEGMMVDREDEDEEEAVRTVTHFKKRIIRTHSATMTMSPVEDCPRMGRHHLPPTTPTRPMAVPLRQRLSQEAPSLLPKSPGLLSRSPGTLPISPGTLPISPGTLPKPAETLPRSPVTLWSSVTITEPGGTRPNPPNAIPESHETLPKSLETPRNSPETLPDPPELQPIFPEMLPRFPETLTASPEIPLPRDLTGTSHNKTDSEEKQDLAKVLSNFYATIDTVRSPWRQKEIIAAGVAQVESFLCICDNYAKRNFDPEEHRAFYSLMTCMHDFAKRIKVQIIRNEIRYGPLLTLAEEGFYKNAFFRMFNYISANPTNDGPFPAIDCCFWQNQVTESGNMIVWPIVGHTSCASQCCQETKKKDNHTTSKSESNETSTPTTSAAADSTTSANENKEEIQKEIEDMQKPKKKPKYKVSEILCIEIDSDCDSNDEPEEKSIKAESEEGAVPKIESVSDAEASDKDQISTTDPEQVPEIIQNEIRLPTTTSETHPPKTNGTPTGKTSEALPQKTKDIIAPKRNGIPSPKMNEVLPLQTDGISSTKTIQIFPPRANAIPAPEVIETPLLNIIENPQSKRIETRRPMIFENPQPNPIGYPPLPTIENTPTRPLEQHPSIFYQPIAHSRPGVVGHLEHGIIVHSQQDLGQRPQQRTSAHPQQRIAEHPQQSTVEHLRQTIVERRSGHKMRALGNQQMNLHQPKRTRREPSHDERGVIHQMPINNAPIMEEEIFRQQFPNTVITRRDGDVINDGRVVVVEKGTAPEEGRHRMAPPPYPVSNDPVPLIKPHPPPPPLQQPPPYSMNICSELLRLFPTLSAMDAMDPLEYVKEINELCKIPSIPEEFKHFYAYVTKVQILHKNNPITFRLFLELLNQGGLKEYQHHYREYSAKKVFLPPPDINPKKRVYTKR